MPAPDKTQQVLDQIAIWEPRIAVLASWGVDLFHVVEGVVRSASSNTDAEDDQIIAALKPKWQALINTLDQQANTP